MSKYFILFVTLLLVGCGNNPTIPDVKLEPSVPVFIDCGGVDKLPFLRLRPFQWQLLERAGITYFALSPEHYNNLALNSVDILRNVEIMRKQIDFYLDCTTRTIENISDLPPQGDVLF